MLSHTNTAHPLDRRPCGHSGQGAGHARPFGRLAPILSHAIAWLAVAGFAVAVVAGIYGVAEMLWAMSADADPGSISLRSTEPLRVSSAHAVTIPIAKAR